MVLTLTTATFFGALGITAWLIGWVFEYQGIAVIGAVIVVGLGAGILQGGVYQQTGQTRVINNSTANTTVTVDYQYEQVGTPERLPFGALVVLLGGLGVLQSFNRIE